MALMRSLHGRRNTHTFVSAVTVAEFLEGARDREEALALLAPFRVQPLGHQHAVRCAEIQKRATAKGRRFGENDAWQCAVADRANARIVGRDRQAFEDMGDRYIDFSL